MRFLYQIIWTNLVSLVLFTSHYKIDIKRHMGTNTVYPVLTDKQPEISVPNNCKLENLFLIARHGTRYPEGSDLEKFDELEKVFQNTPSASKHKWKNRFSLSKEALLYSQGQKEHYLLGKRAHKKYRKFWKKVLPYDPNIIKFRSSKVSRTGMSGTSYSLGLLDGEGTLGRGDSQPIYIYTVEKSQDYELAIHESCSLWKDTVEENNKVLEEQVSQFVSTNLTEISDRISKKYKIHDLKPIHAYYIYKACAFDLIFFNDHDNWCGLLHQKDILILEYFSDMRGYYQFSYGNDLNKRIACKLVSKLVKSVDKYLNGKSTVKANLMFTHSETIMFLHTILGLYEDSKPLTGNATFDEISDRKFKTSEICPFAANVYFEIYTCESHKSLFFAGEKSTIVQMVVNDAPAVIPGCGGTKYCEWSKFKELMGDHIGCNFKDICKIK